MIYADRLDANFSDTAMRLLKDHPFDVATKVKAAALKSAPLMVHDFASGSLKPSMIRRILERYRAKGIIFDLIVVDYADICSAEHPTGEFRHDSNSFWVDLRGIGYEQNAAILTATQTNREGAKKMTATGLDVAEDINKTRNVDLLISINATPEEIDSNEVRLFAAASRNQKEFHLRIQQDREKMRFIKKVLGKV
jgi:replicative DNA helicase